MLRYIVKRLIHTIFVIWAISVIVFLLGRVVGNPVFLLLPQDATAADADRLSHQLGLDRPLVEQYLLFASRAIQGDFGDSFRHRLPALPLALMFLPATIQLAGVAFLISVLIAVPLGILSAARQNTMIDHVVRVFSLSGQAMPTFWFGIVLILFFSVQLRLLRPRATARPPISSCRPWRSGTPRRRRWRGCCARPCSKCSARTTPAPPAPRG